MSGPRDNDGNSGSRDAGADRRVGADRSDSGPVAPADAADGGSRGNRGTIARGLPCTTANECASGYCFDGVCCNADCSAVCWSCAVAGTVGTCVPAEVGSDPRRECPDDGLVSCGRDGACDGSGQCRKYPPGVICRPSSCRGATLTQAYRCDGVGSCALTSGQPCEPYVCDGAGTQCLTTCRTSADCVPGRVCIAGRCGRNPLGAACTSGDDCNSNICQQSVCCATACAGTCRSCALPGSAGTCTNVPLGEDPLAQCVDQAAASCGTDGTCNGAGACRFYAVSTVCSPATCASSIYTPQSACDGVGVCHTGPSTNCGLYQCGPSGCKTSCTVSTDCTPPNVCIGSTCGAPTNLKLQYLCRAANPSEQSPKPQFQIINLAATPVPLSELTIRYWYTVDGVQPQSAAVDYASVGNANITTTFTALPIVRANADFFLQIGFTASAGSLAGGGANSGQIQVRFNKANFGPYTQTNDYSFDATKTVAFADWNRVTLYRNGILAWGEEPAAP